MEPRAMHEPEAILAKADRVLIVDWPSIEVPETLARAGYAVVVEGGPEQYATWLWRDEKVEIEAIDRRPERADLVYAHRPIVELPDLVAVARELGAGTIWLQSGLAPDGTRDPHGCWMPEERSAEARGIVESAGLAYLDHPYIVDVVGAIAHITEAAARNQRARG
jgi:predicted CoA-binding protein